MIKTKRINMVLLGPPGAGKGTQAAILIKAYDLLHISTGEMLRGAIKEGGEIGQKIQGYMNSGELVPDEIVTESVIDRLGKPDAAGGVILDGYPRTGSQAKSLDAALTKENRSLDVVLYLKTSEEVVIERLSGRRLCTECGKNYHVRSIPPKKEGICDTCQVALVQREDDNPEIIKKRLNVYKQQAEDLIAYYEKKGLLYEVNSDLQAEELFDDIDALLRDKGLVDDSSDE